MPETSDMDFVRAYARDNSEPAFAELVQRHIHLVYSVALRYTGNAEDAQDVTQAVFILLAKKAAGLRDRTVITGWLYETTRFTSARLLRTNTRRHAREKEAYMQSTLNEPGTENVWRQLEPHLEEAMSDLGERDRTLLALRFYENKTGAAAAALLGIREDAAHKRTVRALEKLRRFFSKRGVVSTTASIAGAISANSVQAAPAALAKSVTALAMTKGAAAGGSTLTLIKGALKIMAWTKMKTALVIGVAALLAVGTTTVVVKKFTSPSVEGYFTNLDADLDTAPPLVLLRPTRYAGREAYIVVTQPGMPHLGKVMRRNWSFAAILASAYNTSRERVVLPADAPEGKFDELVTVPDHQEEALRQEIKKQFGLVGRLETRDTDVLALRVSHPAGSRLKIGTGSDYTINEGNGKFAVTGCKMSDVANFLGADYLNLPVIDETGLTDSYNLEFQWDANARGDDKKKEIERAINGQGLELVPTNMPIEMLVVEKAE